MVLVMPPVTIVDRGHITNEDECFARFYFFVVNSLPFRKCLVYKHANCGSLSDVENEFNKKPVSPIMS